MDFISHLFGLCGEGHPSALYLLGAVPFFTYIKSKIHLCWLKITSYLKKMVKNY